MDASLACLLCHNPEITANFKLPKSLHSLFQGMKQHSEQPLYTVDEYGSDNISSRSQAERNYLSKSSVLKKKKTVALQARP